MPWKSFLREILHFFKRGNTPLSSRPEKIAVPPLPNWGCYHHVCNHAAAQHNIMCDLLWFLICAAAHICTWCASHAVSNIADTGITHRKFRGCFKGLWRIAPYASSQEFNLSSSSLSIKADWLTHFGISSLKDQRGQIHPVQWMSAFLMTVSYWENLSISRGDAGMEVAACLLGSGSYFRQRSTNPLGCILSQKALMPKISHMLKF